MSKAGILSALASWLTPDASGNIIHGAPPAQFDKSAKIPTTAFVQRALGNLQGVVAPVASSSLSVAQIGSYVEYTTGSGIVTTLPSAAACPAGTFTFYNNTGSTVSIAAASGQNINVGRVNIAAFNLTPGDNAIAVSDGTSWTVLGSMQLVQSSLFAGSLANNGYQKHPNGMILQWGGTGASVAGGSSVIFPIVFPNAVLNVTLGATTVGSACFPSAPNTGYNTSGFPYAVWNASTGQSVAGLGSNYIAIGY